MEQLLTELNEKRIQTDLELIEEILTNKNWVEVDKLVREVLNIDESQEDNIRTIIKTCSDRLIEAALPDWDTSLFVLRLLITLSLDNDETRQWRRDLQLKQAAAFLTEGNTAKSLQVFTEVINEADSPQIKADLREEISDIVRDYVSPSVFQTEWSLRRQAVDSLRTLLPSDTIPNNWLETVSEILRKADETLGDRDREIENLKAEIKDVDQKRENVANKFLGAEQTIVYKEKIIGEKNEQLNNALRKLKTAEQVCQQAKTELILTEQSLRETKNLLDHKERDLAGLKQQIDKIIGQLNQKQIEVDDKDKKIIQQEQQATALEQKLNHAIQTLEQTQAEVSSLEKTIKDNEKYLEEHQKGLTQKDRRLKEAAQGYSNLTAQIINLRDSLNQKDDTLNQQRLKIESLEYELNDATQDLDQSKNNLAVATETIKGSLRKIEELEQQFSQKEQDLTNTNRRLKDSTTKVDTLNKFIALKDKTIKNQTLWLYIFLTLLILTVSILMLNLIGFL